MFDNLTLRRPLNCFATIFNTAYAADKKRLREDFFKEWEVHFIRGLLPPLQQPRSSLRNLRIATSFGGVFAQTCILS